MNLFSWWHLLAFLAVAALAGLWTLKVYRGRGAEQRRPQLRFEGWCLLAAAVGLALLPAAHLLEPGHRRAAAGLALGAAVLAAGAVAFGLWGLRPSRSGEPRTGSALTLPPRGQLARAAALVVVADAALVFALLSRSWLEGLALALLGGGLLLGAVLHLRRPSQKGWAGQPR